MKVVHRGYELVAKRQKALGGWYNTYYHACRIRDGYMLIDNFSEGDTPADLVDWMKRVVDNLIDAYRGRVDRLDDAMQLPKREPTQ